MRDTTGERQSEWRAETLIVAEITGSITSAEKAELEKLRAASACVCMLSADYRRILDPQIDEIRHVRTTAEQIIEMAKRNEKRAEAL
jgi:hypothetical protein